MFHRRALILAVALSAVAAPPTHAAKYYTPYYPWFQPIPPVVVAGDGQAGLPGGSARSDIGFDLIQMLLTRLLPSIGGGDVSGIRSDIASLNTSIQSLRGEIRELKEVLRAGLIPNTSPATAPSGPSTGGANGTNGTPVAGGSSRSGDPTSEMLTLMRGIDVTVKQINCRLDRSDSVLKAILTHAGAGTMTKEKAAELLKELETK